MEPTRPDHDNEVGRQSRREFVRRIGTAVFSIAIVDVAHETTAPRAMATIACGTSNTPDSSCGGISGNSDANCVGQGGDKDDNCNPGGAIYTADPDGNCGKAAPKGGTSAGPGHTDPDDHCSATFRDGNCGIAQGKGSGVYDQDQSCSKTVTDNSCGDCDDTHQTDQTCGNKVGGVVDQDNLCGHAHWRGPPGGLTNQGDEDQACSATVKDVGCGQHNTTYNSWNDPDQSCVGGAVDSHCTGKATDATCKAAANPSTTNPDESCSATSPDTACGHYDADENCTTTSPANSDQACGFVWINKDFPPGIGTWSTDADQSCAGYPADVNSGKENTGPVFP